MSLPRVNISEESSNGPAGAVFKLHFLQTLSRESEAETPFFEPPRNQREGKNEIREISKIKTREVSGQKRTHCPDERVEMADFISFGERRRGRISKLRGRAKAVRGTLNSHPLTRQASVTLLGAREREGGGREAGRYDLDTISRDHFPSFPGRVSSLTSSSPVLETCVLRGGGGRRRLMSAICCEKGHALVLSGFPSRHAH